MVLSLLFEGDILDVLLTFKENFWDYISSVILFPFMAITHDSRFAVIFGLPLVAIVLSLIYFLIRFLLRIKNR